MTPTEVQYVSKYKELHCQIQLSAPIEDIGVFGTMSNQDDTRVVTAADVVSTDPSWCCPLLGAYLCEQARRGCYCHELHLINQHLEKRKMDGN
jgi:hypothetical protein